MCALRAPRDDNAQPLSNPARVTRSTLISYRRLTARVTGSPNIRPPARNSEGRRQCDGSTNTDRTLLVTVGTPKKSIDN
jgi:hypothetical protein